MSYKTDTQRITSITNQIDALKTTIYNKYINPLTITRAGNQGTLVPESYQEILDLLSTSFDQILTTANGLAIGGTVMDQLIVALTPLYLMHANFPKNIMDALNPNTATGYPRIVLAAMSGIFPQPILPTTVTLKVKGVQNTTVQPLSLLIKPIDRETQFYNMESFTLDTNGEAMVDFVAQIWGPEILVPQDTYVILTSVVGVNSVMYDANNGSQISIGQFASTDQELKENMIYTLNGRAQNGFNNLLQSLINQVPSANSIVTVLNNENFDVIYPEKDGVTTFPSTSIVASLSCESTDTTNEQIANAMYANRTFAPAYPLDCPIENQKVATIQVDTQVYSFKWVKTTPIIVQFTVVVSSPHAWYNVDNADLKNAILQQFNQGSAGYPKVTQGIPFLISTFDGALRNKGLPSYTITMNFKTQPIRAVLCSYIWQQPVTNADEIFINWSE